MANKNSNLGAAKTAKNDEFYTQYLDIQKEVNAYVEYNPDVFKGKTILLPCDDPEWSNFTRFFVENFELLGLKKLISTSYAVESKKIKEWEPTLFETEAPQYDADKSRTNGKIFILDGDKNNNGTIDVDDLKWEYLEGDGDFRSEEVKKLRDEADVIITNPPFSLWREFLAWILEGKDKQFVIIGNQNAITYRDVFPHIKENKMWLGHGFSHGDAYFRVPVHGRYSDQEYFNKADGIVHFRNCCWFTNIDHGKRHEPMQLMTMKDNLKFSRHKDIKEGGYPRYENYNAIDVPYTDAIPSDYTGIMGVPITFLDKYCPEQFEIIWRGGDMEWAESECDFFTPPDKIRASIFKKNDKTWRVQNPYTVDVDDVHHTVYQRIFIRKK